MATHPVLNGAWCDAVLLPAGAEVHGSSRNSEGKLELSLCHIRSNKTESKSRVHSAPGKPLHTRNRVHIRPSAQPTHPTTHPTAHPTSVTA